MKFRTVRMNVVLGIHPTLWIGVILDFVQQYTTTYVVDI